MSLFGNLKSDGLEETQDRLGGFSAFETDIYTAKIKVAFAGKSAAGARSVTLIADINGREYRETIYVTNKQGENFFLSGEGDKKKKVPLPGYTTVDDICMFVTGKPLSEQDPSIEDKMVKVYDPEVGKELPKSVPVLTSLTDETIALGIVKQRENKAKKDNTGKYVAVSEERTLNFIDKVFHPTEKFTVTEVRNGAEKAGFWDSWLEHNKGKERDKRTIKDGVAGQTGRPSGARAAAGPPQAGATQSGRPSLFGKKS